MIAGVIVPGQLKPDAGGSGMLIAVLTEDLLGEFALLEGGAVAEGIRHRDEAEGGGGDGRANDDPGTGGGEVVMLHDGGLGGVPLDRQVGQ